MDYASQKLIPGGSSANKKFYGPSVEKAKGVDQVLFDVLFDAQTSGGLLIAVSQEKAHALVSALKAQEVESAVVIGRVMDPPVKIKVI